MDHCHQTISPATARRMLRIVLLSCVFSAVQLVACTPDAQAENPAAPLNTQSSASAPVAAPSTSAPTTLPTFPAAPADGNVYCADGNQGCDQRYPWWALWSDNQPRDLVQFASIPGLTAERRFAESVLLLSLWSDGLALLRRAASQGLTIIGVPPSSLSAPAGLEVIGVYMPQRHAIGVSETYASTSLWMVADTIAHEAQHAADYATGTDIARSPADCIAREQRARRVEQGWLRYVATRFGGFPSESEVDAYLSDSDQALFADLMDIYRSGDIDRDTAKLYQRTCEA